MVYGLERYREAETRLALRTSQTPRERFAHSFATGGGSQRGGVPVMEIARSYGVSHSTISRLA